MPNILNIRKPSDYSLYMGQKDTHELITVIDFNELSPVHYTLNRYEVYGFFLQGKDEAVDLTYGTGKYDYSDGTLICVAPGQIGGKEDDGKLVNLSGWALLFHPDILQGTGLEKEIKDFSFFDYRINEALHMSEEERDIMISLFRQIKNELKFPADGMQNRIIAGFINLLLRYAQRFYNRQFVSRTITNNDILTRFEKLLKDYFERDKQLTQGIPTVQFCSEQLNMSPTYFSDIVKKTTGETANHYIKQCVIQLAKNRLVSGMSSSEVAYSLGFEYPQHFSRTFKKITGETPKEYCEHRQASK
ncbi:MAG: helix-turn-helix domain-containing protein [Muribaculaceae bacterium]|nr:helix-turn-helix domain-containing protein [Muribaculaceae bacterium]MDE7093132.1 helix-turn-helix domain-containing protein [Muribaculaceae bacterium]